MTVDGESMPASLEYKHERAMCLAYVRAYMRARKLVRSLAPNYEYLSSSLPFDYLKSRWWWRSFFVHVLIKKWHLGIQVQV